MATERARRRLAAATLGGLALLLLSAPAAAATSPAASPAPPVPTPRPVPASEPWWVRVSLAGQRVVGVRANGDTIVASIATSPLTPPRESKDGGRTWNWDLAGESSDFDGVPRSPWREVDGRIGQVDAAGFWQADPGSPTIAPTYGPDSGYGMIAAPAALPGVVAAVDRDNVVWRRGSDGRWARALLLLPQGIASGPPRVTALAAFDTAPLSDTVYMGTDGYSVLISTDGGDDWIRAGPGLPDHVYALATDPVEQAVYAGTSDGLWVHHLRALPAPAVYPDAALRWRWLGIALVTLAGAAVATAGLLRALR